MVKNMVSVIVPIYNAEAYLEKTIDSILTQSYSNIELILIDDGSKDNSLLICKSFEKLDKRIHTYSFPNGGVALARERGFNLSKGEFISFVDSDDILEKEFVLQLLRAIQENSADMACCNCMDYNGPNLSISNDCIITNNRNYFIDSFLENKRFCYCIWAKIFTRKLLHELEFPKMKYAEDTLFITQCFQKASIIALLKYVGYNYTDNPNGAMRRAIGIRQASDNLVLQDYVYDICLNQYQSKCAIINEKITNELFNMICADADMPIKIRKKDCVTIKSYIAKYKGRISGTVKGNIIKIYYYVPAIINILIRIRHFMKLKK